MRKNGKDFAWGCNFNETKAYIPEIRPGFTSWVCLWPVAGQEKEFMLSFVEMRKGRNPVFQPVSLDFYNSMNLPYKYQITLCNGAKDIITENVILHSKDNGETWTEVGRSCDPFGQAIGFTYESMPNGDILRAVSNAYMTFYPEDEQKLIIQKSCDMGNTWEHYSTVLSGFFHFPHRLRRLKDGTMVLVSPYTESFGPWTKKKARSVLRSEVLVDLHMTVYISNDDGMNWSGPLSMFQGYNIQEVDFVELPSGDLLFIESGIFSPSFIPPLRQYLYKTPYGYVPGPVMKSFSGPSPETVVLTNEGLLVGTTRGKVYCCSNNHGKNWHVIDGIPNTGYQPMIKQLDDGSFMTAWHYGGDNIFAEIDQYIGIHRFSMEENLPGTVTISLDRDMDIEKKRFTNSYTVLLKQDDEPLPGRKIRFSVSHRGTEAFQKPDPREEGEHMEKVTDENGKTTLELNEYDRQRDIHAGYKITADYVPEDQDIEKGLAPCESDVFFFYGINGVAKEAYPYRLFYAGSRLYAVGEILKEYPQLKEFVKEFGESTEFDLDVVSMRLDIEKDRVEKMINLLCSEYILVKRENVISWTFSRFSQKLKEVREIDTEDCFV